jgi:hypothetical protein
LKLLCRKTCHLFAYCIRTICCDFPRDATSTEINENPNNSVALFHPKHSSPAPPLPNLHHPATRLHQKHVQLLAQSIELPFPDLDFVSIVERQLNLK